MPVQNGSSIVSFDASAAFDAATAASDGPVYAFVEYDVDEYNAVYVADAALAMYGGDESAMYHHFDHIHDYVHMDFTEHDLFQDSLFPNAERVRYAATGMDYMTFLRVYGDREGVFCALEPDEDVARVVEAVEAFVPDA